jgi:hypothetical protein
MHCTIAKINSQDALQDNERLICILVIVPNEVVLQLHNLELVVVLMRGYVDTLRKHDVPWADIGEALGISRQAAWERFR